MMTFGARRTWRAAGSGRTLASPTVSFHNFKSQSFKSSASNPKSRYVAFASVLSQMSNRQSLGRKHKHEMLKTDRISYTPSPPAKNFPAKSP